MLLFALVRSPYERKLIASAQQRKTVLGGVVPDGELAFFSTWCPAGTPIETLVRIEGHRWAIEELTQRNIPFVKFGGLKFLDSAHVKDLLSLLRFAQNPRDRVAGFRLMQLIPGVGPTSAQRVLDQMADQADPIGYLTEVATPPRAGFDWSGFVEVMQALRLKSAACRPSTYIAGQRRRRSCPASENRSPGE